VSGEVALHPGEEPDPSVLRAMLEALHHRGPDDSGEHIAPGVALGATRLSIIDLAGGHQPIENEDGNLWIVFNGELYNFADLRGTLERRGHRFRTSCDTEVVLHAYEEFGPECVELFNGMFAFGVWDQRERRLFLARDRIGIKPLYYARTPSSFVFASELRALLVHPAIEARLDLVAVDEYLTFEYVPAPRTILSNVSKLEAGHHLTLHDGRVETRRYWDPNLLRSETGRKSEAEYSSELRMLLSESVRRELVSDVPVGILLSGGIDSSAVAAAAVQAAPGQISTFSVGFDDPSFDESRYARQVAQVVGSDHHEVQLTSQPMLDLVPRLGELLDEPLGDSSFIPTYLLSEYARRYVKVVLAGDGGDELFGGYPTLQAHRLVEYYERFVPGIIRRELLGPAIGPAIGRLPTSFDNISLDFKAKRIVSGRGLPIGVRHHLWLGSFSPDQKAELLQPWVRLGERDTFGIVHSHHRNCRAQAQLNQLLYLDMKMYLEGDILTKVDRASMACSLEVRVPLLNHSFVEFATTVPHDLKLHGMTTKYILRRSMRGILPREILRRPKKGFNMPVAKWLAGPLRDLAHDVLSERRIREEGLFRPEYIDQLLREHEERQADRRKELWTLLTFELWHQRLKSGAESRALAPSSSSARTYRRSGFAGSLPG
jgi:asparagine synthase (glutamine-hydrolysing)